MVRVAGRETAHQAAGSLRQPAGRLRGRPAAEKRTGGGNRRFAFPRPGFVPQARPVLEPGPGGAGPPRRAGGLSANPFRAKTLFGTGTRQTNRNTGSPDAPRRWARRRATYPTAGRLRSPQESMSGCGSDSERGDWSEDQPPRSSPRFGTARVRGTPRSPLTLRGYRFTLRSDPVKQIGIFHY